MNGEAPESCLYEFDLRDFWMIWGHGVHDVISDVINDYLSWLVADVNIDYKSRMTEKPSRRAHHHGNLKEALVLYALGAAEEGAIEMLSLRAAARDLGVSPGAVYRHFADKEALMQELAARGFDMLAASFEAEVAFASAAKDAEDARSRLRALAAAYVDFASRYYGLWRLMFGPSGAQASARSSERPDTYDWLGKVLQEMHEADLIAPLSREGQFFAWTAVHGLSDLQASPAIDVPDLAARVDAHCHAIERALR